MFVEPVRSMEPFAKRIFSLGNLKNFHPIKDILYFAKSAVANDLWPCSVGLSLLFQETEFCSYFANEPPNIFKIVFNVFFTFYISFYRRTSDQYKLLHGTFSKGVMLQDVSGVGCFLGERKKVSNDLLSNDNAILFLKYKFMWKMGSQPCAQRLLLYLLGYRCPQ